MSNTFAVKKLESVLAPSFCGDMGRLASAGDDWSLLFGVYTAGLSGYGQLACYLWG